MTSHLKLRNIPLSRSVLILILIISLSIPYSFLSLSSISSSVQSNLDSWNFDFLNQGQLPVTGGEFASLISVIHLPPPTIDSWNSRDHLPSLRKFVTRVENGQDRIVRGVYVPGFLALPVVQQPGGNGGYVSGKADTLTQFQLAARYDVIGLLAHNFLSGKEFFRLKDGLQVMVVRGDGSIDRYRITGVREFQKVSPGSNWSHYIDLKTGERLTTYQVFSQYYQGEHHLTFQTCLERDGIETWGLRFVVAEPLQ
jgi:hypothetical protein